MDEVRVSSWPELNELLYDGSWKEEIGRFRSDFAFRGRGVVTDDLRTGLARLGGDAAEVERHLLRNFHKYALRSNPHGDSAWYWLTLAQHHGLPTRLLDWTYSPFVALHFATAEPEQYGEDAAVWCVDFVKAHRLLPVALRNVLKEEGALVFTAEMLTRLAPTLPEFDRLAGARQALFFEPPSLDDRIVSQSALFSVMSGATASLDKWLADHPSVCRRIVIPRALKWEVRDKLDQVNITERVLFPGLDGLTRWLRRQYAPKPAAP